MRDLETYNRRRPSQRSLRDWLKGLSGFLALAVLQTCRARTSHFPSPAVPIVCYPAPWDGRGGPGPRCARTPDPWSVISWGRALWTASGG
eukprot:CAMPEP_0198210960 /NCGR_PEP_ID=MMETSP1445-20131203/22542_1 /TAXON_ID=36898 /ORGANISM="Pyramimonas sp., Strain CCMP2087" /LENGTH=89 /DNA_ID=CAMNT_0043885129 /DNA_START=253 /DNA_END=518 /DNA_ORIENTATION=+